MTRHISGFFATLVLVVVACGGSRKPAELFLPASMATNAVAQLQGESGTPVAIDLGALDAERIHLDLGHGVAVIVERLRVERRADGYSWYGQIGSKGFVALVVANQRVTGDINTGTELFQIIPASAGPANTHSLVRRSWAIPREHPPEFAEVQAHPGPKPPPDLTLDPTKSRPMRITLIAAYTTAVWKARNDVKAMIQLAVDETNLANANSHVGIQFELADVYEATGYEENSDFYTNLWRFKEKGDLYLETVHTRRNLRHADLAVLVLDCKSTYLGMSMKVMASEDTAFAAVDYRFIDGYFTFGHELGHLMGLRHDPKADPETDPFPDDHGYLASGWRTIMAVVCSDPGKCPRLAYWSNPEILVDGEPAGTKDASNSARVLNSVAKTVSKFR